MDFGAVRRMIAERARRSFKDWMLQRLSPIRRALMTLAVGWKLKLKRGSSLK